MARDSESREDLIRDATALVERGEFAVPGEPMAVIVGFRADGCASCYFGEDPAVHFNTADELRRAFVGGLLYKAEKRRLVSLRRARAEGEVALLRHELAPLEEQALLHAIAKRLDRLQAALQAGQATLLRQVPAHGDIAARVLQWATSLPRPIAVAMAPHAR
jgi:hypothetical protein